MLTRRRLLVSGGAIIGMTALGGCTADDGDSTDDGNDGSSATDGSDGSSDDGSTDGNDEPEYTFAVEDFVYTTQRARSFGQYTPQPETAYRDGEMVWVYIEVSNVTPTSSGPHLDTEWVFRDPDGEELISTEESVRIPEGSLGELPNEAFVTQGVDTSFFETPTGGEYTLDVRITDRESGETEELSRTVRILKFDFERVVFAAEEPTGMDDVVEQPTATYERGDDVWIYLEVVDPPVDDTGTANLAYTFEVRPPEGGPWQPIEGTHEFRRVQFDEVFAFWEALLTYGDDPLGEYEVQITVEAMAQDEELQTTESFTLEEGG